MEKAYKLEFDSDQSEGLALGSCGFSRTEPLHSFGPAVRPHFLIHFILTGRGRFTIGNKTYPLKAGYGFVIEPDELTYYEADGEDPWTYVWVGFHGKDAGEYLHKMGLSVRHPIFTSESSEELYQIVREMIGYNTMGIANDLRRNGLLHLFLAQIAQSTSLPEKSEEDKANTYVTKAIEFIQSNYCNPIKITDVADYVCINRSYLYTLFEEYMKISPQQFLTMFRITKATELLRVTNFTIESIALSCGYNDALVFNKAFKQCKGMSPSVFRKEAMTGGIRNSKDNLESIESFIQSII